MDSSLGVVKGFLFRTGLFVLQWVNVKKLGSGGFGEVHLASVSNTFTQLVAVKSCPSPSPSLQKEHRVLGQFLGCPNIVQCYGEIMSMENKVPRHNLFLEYADGGNLLDLIKEYGGTIPESHVWFYTKMIVEELCRIHEKGYVHCDIKTQNILVYGSNQRGRLSTLKIADFGLAKEPGETSPSIRGTYDYMSPETSRYGKINAAVDIWSLGCVVAEMLCGKRPSKDMFSGETMEPELQIEQTDRIPRNMWDAGKDLKDFLGSCFIRDPDERWSAKRLLTHEFLSPNYKQGRVILPHELMHQNRNTKFQLPHELMHQNRNAKFQLPHELMQRNHNADFQLPHELMHRNRNATFKLPHEVMQQSRNATFKLPHELMHQNRNAAIELPHHC